MEGIVTVTHVDQSARTVTIVGPKGNSRTVSVPPESKNFDQVKPGQRYKVRFLEEIAVSVSKNGQPSAGSGATVALAPKGGRPGGNATRTVTVSALVESVDPKNHEITLKGPEGSRTLKVAEDVKLEAIKPGDNINVTHTQALAIDMAPSPQPMVEPHWTP